SARHGRSRIARCATGPWVSAVIAGLSPSAAMGSPGTGRRRWIITQAATPMPAASRYTAATHTATNGVGVCGHAWVVRPARTSLKNIYHERAVVPPLSQAAACAPAHPSAARPTADQQHASTVQGTAAALVAEARGPSARLMTGALADLRGWP